jgi:hypothetical protein
MLRLSPLSASARRCTCDGPSRAEQRSLVTHVIDRVLVATGAAGRMQ